MRTSIDRALRHVERFEGGWSDDPSDPGGKTYFGLALNRIGKRLGITTEAELRAITRDQARMIFVQEYWLPIRADDMPEGPDLYLFDTAINQGVRRAGKFAQKACRSMGRNVAVDGVIGPKTIEAIHDIYKTHDGRRGYLGWLCVRRLAHYTSLVNLAKFRWGWFRRVGEAAWHYTALARY